MKLSTAFAHATKEVSAEEVSVNAQLLTRAGFIDKSMAGVYSYLPLGLRVLQNIERIVREEMDSAGGQEILMPALQPKENWEITGRWDGLDVLFKVPSLHGGREYALGPTHEEIVVPLAKKFVRSYRDLPRYVYQIQTKFRDEPRAKSGVLRGREFVMKDLYSFHTDKDDLSKYYETMQSAYKRVFERCGLEAAEVLASGGTFSKYSHEYQVFTENGEDKVFVCGCGYAVNDEIAEVNAGDACPECDKGVIEEKKAIEVGNIFELNLKYSEPFDLQYTDDDGAQKPVYMGCYGIGISRLMGAIAEVHHDKSGLVWPVEIAPAQVHIVRIGDGGVEMVDELISALEKAGIQYLYDDRGLSAGAALVEADLIGLPWRVVVSGRSIEAGGVELTNRATGNNEIVDISSVLAALK